MCLLTQIIMPYITFLFVSSDFCRLACYSILSWSPLRSGTVHGSSQTTLLLANGYSCYIISGIRYCFAIPGVTIVHSGLTPYGLSSIKLNIIKELLLNLPFKAHTHIIVNAGFGGFQRFVARIKGRCKLIGNRLVIPHDTILSTVVGHLTEPLSYKISSYRIMTIGYLSNQNESYRIV